MPMTATQVWPDAPAIAPARDGLRREIWRLTGDGSATSIAVTASTLTKVLAAIGAGDSTNDAAGTGATVTFTFAAAVANGAYCFVELVGQQ